MYLLQLDISKAIDNSQLSWKPKEIITYCNHRKGIVKTFNDIKNLANFISLLPIFLDDHTFALFDLQ